MRFRERVLLHQVHALKLVTDVTTALAAAWLLWRQRLTLALLVGLVPPIVVSALLLRYADLESLRHSALGRYVARFMTRRVEMARLFGLVVIWAGAWVQRPVAMAAGLAIILCAWLWGMGRRALASRD